MKRNCFREYPLAILGKLSVVIVWAFAVAMPPVALAKLPPQWTTLTGMFDATLAEDHVVGGSVALVERGHMVARRDYGFADQANHKPVDGDTIFHWASNTKTLNAISIMQLRDRGLLTLNDRITRYLPELRAVHNPFGSMDDITLRMLMDHSAGFQPTTWPYKQGVAWEPFEPTTWQQLVAMMPYQEIAFMPGSQYSYSNPAWIYLARTLEILTGDQWENYIQKNVFAPIGMSRSYFGSTPYYLLPQRSHRYVVKRDENGKWNAIDYGADFDPGITIPNGGWNAPLADVVAYISFLTGSTGGNEALRQRYDAVLKRSTLDEMWQPQLPTSTEPDAPFMGLGFFLLTQSGRNIVGHTGGQGGFSTFFYFNRATGRGVVAAFNSAVTIEGEDHLYFSKIREQALKVLADVS